MPEDSSKDTSAGEPAERGSSRPDGGEEEGELAAAKPAPAPPRPSSGPPPSLGSSSFSASSSTSSPAIRVSSTPPPVSAPPSAEDDPRIGAVLLDRVRIVRPIARGGMGKVYYGEQVGMKRPCAIKILDPRLAGADTADFARRFQLEASTTAKLTHPNAVTIFDYGETEDGSCFIAMEYLEGRSLSDELKQHGTVSADRAIHITRQVCRALREAHALGVVHRDMKPANVFLLSRDDDDDFVKVLDFGLVKETSPHEGQEHTQIGQIMGSPRYMAPEQVQGKSVDGRTDIYSVGATLFAMLAGRPPFDKATELATMMAHVSDPPPTFASVAPELVLPPGLEAVVLKCLAKQPEDRFSSMEELITALKLRPGAMATSSDSGQDRVSLLTALAEPRESQVPAPKRRPPVLLIVALLVGLALSVALMMRPGDDAPPALSAQPSPAVPPPGPSSAPAPRPPPAAPKVTATLHVDTDPPGVKVKEEGEVICQATPCDIVYSGEQADPAFEHLLTFLKSDYKLERKIVKLSASPLSVKLTRAR
jgi:serine/threonine protein kinase